MEMNHSKDLHIPKYYYTVGGMLDHYKYSICADILHYTLQTEPAQYWMTLVEFDISS